MLHIGLRRSDLAEHQIGMHRFEKEMDEWEELMSTDSDSSEDSEWSDTTRDSDEVIEGQSTTERVILDHIARLQAQL